MVMAPVVRGRKGEFEKLFEQFRLEGYSRVRVDSELRRLDEEIKLDKKYNHDISVVVDRLVMKGDLRRRLSESIEAAAGLAGGVVEIDVLAEGTGEAKEREPAETSAGSRERRARVSCRRASPIASPSASASPASTAAPRSRSWSRGSSPSTRPTAPASAATGSASSGWSTPSWSSPTRRCRSPRARCSPGGAATPATGSGWSRRSPRTTASTPTRPGRSSPTRTARSSSTAPAASATR